MWKGSTSTNALAPKTGVAPTASTKHRQVSTMEGMSESLGLFVLACHSGLYPRWHYDFIIYFFLSQRPLSGVS